MTETGEARAVSEGTVKTLEEEMSAVAHAEMGGALQSAPGLLPGEISAHPTPFKYVMIFLVLVVVTGVEIAISYLDGSVPSGIIVALLLTFGLFKFVIVAAIVLYAVVLAALHAF